MALTTKEPRCPEHPARRLDASLGDGVLIGSCRVCHQNIVRLNPKTGRVEWLDGESPWTANALRPVEIP